MIWMSIFNFDIFPKSFFILPPYWRPDLSQSRFGANDFVYTIYPLLFFIQRQAGSGAGGI